MKTSTIRQQKYRFKNRKKAELKLVMTLFKEYGDLTLLKLYKKIQDDYIALEKNKGE